MVVSLIHFDFLVEELALGGHLVHMVVRLVEELVELGILWDILWVGLL